MTPEETKVAFKKQLLVTVKKSKYKDDLSGGVYRICEFGMWYNRNTKSFDYFVVLVDPEIDRTTYHMALNRIEPMPGYELVIKQFLDNKSKILSDKVANNICK